MNNRILYGLPIDQLGPIGKLVRGQCLHDVITNPNGLWIMCKSGRLIEVAWGDREAELKEFKDGCILDPLITMPPGFRHLCGKVMDSAYTDEGEFKIAFADCHVVAFKFHTHGVQADRVDVAVDIPMPQAAQLIASILGDG